jgi:transposase-like protein
MLYRGIEVTYESIPEWCHKFGQQYANQVSRKQPYLTAKWHLDEVVSRSKATSIICGERWTQRATGSMF